MALSKVAEAVREMFEAVAPGGPEGEERKMFGYPACFLNVKCAIWKPARLPWKAR